MIEKTSFAIFVKFDYLSTLSIDNKDVLDCYFIEDIYSMATMGKISIIDRYGIKEYGPLTGDEKIVIAYGNEGLIEKEFTIYRIAKIEGVVDIEKTEKSVIDVYFTETYFNNLVMKRFSRSWDDSIVASDIIKNIIENMLKIDVSLTNIETSRDVLPLCIPNWSTAETIRWISNRITGTKGKYGYLFYSNSDKLINYVTLDGLFKQTLTDTETYVFDTQDLTYQNKILAWQLSGVNHLATKEVGGGAYLGFNPATKSFIGFEEDETFVYSKAVQEITSLGCTSLFDGNYIDNDPQNFNYVYTLEGETDKTILKNMFYNNFIRRYSLQNSLKVLVEGHDKRYAGMMVEIAWPSHNVNDLFSSVDSGYYLVKSVTHKFSPLSTPLYTQTVVLIKNAYNSSKLGNNTKTSGNNPFDFVLSKFV